jgi:integrase
MNYLRIIKQIGIQENREACREYYKRQIARGLSPKGLYNKLRFLLYISNYLNKPYQDATETDIESLMAYVGSKDYAESTKNIYRFVVKSFYGKDDVRVSWIKIRGNPPNPLTPQELISRDELEELVRKCKRADKKALVRFLYDSAIRPREWAILKRKHFVVEKAGMYVMIPRAKTPARTIYLVESKDFIENLPLERLSYYGMRTFFNITLRRYSKKRIYPYLFRHSRPSASSLGGRLEVPCRGYTSI